MLPRARFDLVDMPTALDMTHSSSGFPISGSLVVDRDFGSHRTSALEPLERVVQLLRSEDAPLQGVGTHCQERAKPKPRLRPSSNYKLRRSPHQ